MVSSPTSRNSVFFQQPHSWSGLARIEYHGLSSAHGFDIRSCDRRDTRKPLNEVQRRALSGEYRGSRAFYRQDNIALGKSKPIRLPLFHTERIIHPLKNLSGDLNSRKNPALTCHDLRTRLGALIRKPLYRKIAFVDIFGQGEFDDVLFSRPHALDRIFKGLKWALVPKVHAANS